MSKTQISNADLFAHVSWKTPARKPMLACDQLRQAAYEAVITRTRTHLCRVLAIGGTDTQVHLVVRFPASLPISEIARISMQASADAMSQLFVTIHARRLDMESIWDKSFTAQTLGPNESADAQTFLQKEIENSQERPSALTLF